MQIQGGGWELQTPKPGAEFSGFVLEIPEEML